MPGIIQEGISNVFQNSTFQNATNEGVKTGMEYVRSQGANQTNVLWTQIFWANCLTVKNAYKAGSKIGVSLVHLSNGGSLSHPPFLCNVASVSCSLADGLSICGDVIAKGGDERPTIRQILM